MYFSLNKKEVVCEKKLKFILAFKPPKKAFSCKDSKKVVYDNVIAKSLKLTVETTSVQNFSFAAYSKNELRANLLPLPPPKISRQNQRPKKGLYFGFKLPDLMKNSILHIF